MNQIILCFCTVLSMDISCCPRAAHSAPIQTYRRIDLILDAKMEQQPQRPRPTPDRMVRSIPHKDGLVQSHVIFKRTLNWKKVIPNRPALAQIIVEGSLAFSFAVLIGIAAWCIFYSLRGRIKQYGPRFKTMAKTNFFLRQIQKQKEEARKKLMKEYELPSVTEEGEEGKREKLDLDSQSLEKVRELFEEDQRRKKRDYYNIYTRGQEGEEEEEEEEAYARKGKKKKKGKKYALKKKLRKVAKHKAIQKGIGKIKKVAKSKAVQKHVGKIKEAAGSKAIRKHVGKIKKVAKSKAVQKHVRKIKKATKPKAIKKHLGKIKKVAKSKAVQKHIYKMKKAAKKTGQEMKLIKMKGAWSNVHEKAKKGGEKKGKGAYKTQKRKKSLRSSQREARHYDEVYEGTD